MNLRDVYSKVCEAVLEAYRAQNRWNMQGVADLVGIKSQHTLYSKLSNDRPNYKLTVDELISLMDVLNTTAPLDALDEAFGRQAHDRSELPTTTRGIVREALAAASEHGDVMRIIESAIEDGIIDHDEFLAIMSEVKEDIAAKERLLAAVENVHRNGGSVQ